MRLGLILTIFGHNWTEEAFRWIQARMQTGGYIVLFGVLFCCGLGLPVPEDIPLLIAGVLVATGKMKLAVAAVCAWCGIIGGDVVLYHLGKVFGLEVRRVRLVGRHLSEKRLEQVHRLFERWGVWVVAVGRMFAGIRGAMVVVAGVTRFTFWKFLIADGLAAVVSGGLFLFLGYQFGRNMDALRHRVEQGKQWTLIAVVVIGIGIAAWVIFRRRRQAHRMNVPGRRAAGRAEVVAGGEASARQEPRAPL